MNLKNIFKALFSGRNHIISRRPCQDYAAYRISFEGYPVLCLSDGAGGARYAELASRANVDAILNYFQKNKAKDFIQSPSDTRANTLVDECIEYLQNTAARYDIQDLSELSATLVLAIITDQTIYIGHIGDGIVAGKTKEGTLQLLSEPENINGASNRTHFTCEYQANKYYKDVICDSKSYSSILLCSDGPYNDIAVEGDVKASFLSLLSNIEDGTITNEIDFSRRISDLAEIRDDWSIIVATTNHQQVIGKTTDNYAQ